MRLRIIISLILLGLFASCNITYVDYDYDPIPKKEFKELVRSKSAFEIPSKMKRSKRLVRRRQFGLIKEKEALYNKLNQTLPLQIKANDYLIVHYYPGETPCRLFGRKSKTDSAYYAQLRKRDAATKKVLKQITPNFKKMLIYQADAKVKDEKVDFHRDPDRLFEKMFFRYEYPCSSVVVIAPDGRFISYLGEHDLKTKFSLLLTLIENKNNKEWKKATR